MEYAATIDPKSKPTAVRKLGAQRDQGSRVVLFVVRIPFQLLPVSGAGSVRAHCLFLQAIT